MNPKHPRILFNKELKNLIKISAPLTTPINFLISQMNTLYLKQYFVTLYVTLSSLITWKLSKKFDESYSSSINYQKNSTTKDKIKTNDHFDNTFKVIE